MHIAAHCKNTRKAAHPRGIYHLSAYALVLEESGGFCYRQDLCGIFRDKRRRFRRRFQLFHLLLFCDIVVYNHTMYFRVTPPRLVFISVCGKLTVYPQNRPRTDVFQFCTSLHVLALYTTASLLLLLLHIPQSSPPTPPQIIPRVWGVFPGRRLSALGRIGTTRTSTAHALTTCTIAPAGRAARLAAAREGLHGGSGRHGQGVAALAGQEL